MISLSLPFFLVAIFYSMVGFGGGSSYVALLALFNLPYESIPQVALVCNLIVVSGGSYHFIKIGFFKFSLFWPFILTSIPFAFIGGRIPVSKEIFFLLLGVSLVAAGSRLLFSKSFKEVGGIKKVNVKLALFIGAFLGMLSGMVGIGGGIFLAPLLLNLKWGRPKEVAAIASAFILVNSLSGIGGQIFKSQSLVNVIEYWPLFVAVFFGGQIGSLLGSGKSVSHARVKILTSVLVLFVGVRLLINNFN